MRKLYFFYPIIILALAGCSILPFGKNAGVFVCPRLVVGVLTAGEENLIAQEQKDGYELALQKINATGIIKDCKLELRYYPEVSEGETSQTQRSVRSIVEEEKAIAILGGTEAIPSMHAASLANYFNIPMIIPSAAGMHILPSDNLWAFRLHPSEETYADAVFRMVREEMGAGMRVGVVYEDTTSGHDAAIAAVNMLEQKEMVVSDYVPFSLSQTDFTPLVTQVSNDQPDVIYFAFDYPVQALGILKALRNSGVTFPLVVARAGGFVSRDFLMPDGTQLNPLAENLVLSTSWISQAENADGAEFIREFSDYTLKAHSQTYTPSLYNAAAYKTLMILSDSLNHIYNDNQSLALDDLQKQREALRTEIQGYREDKAPWGNTSFSTGGQNQGQIYLIQILNNKLVTVYPPALATEKPIILLGSSTNSPASTNSGEQ